jgi:tetratricopeptide (TPR) repeat protein
MSWSAWNNRGDAYGKLREHDKAIADFSNAIQVDPRRWIPWSNRADEYCQLRQYDKAIADYKQAIQLESTRRPLFQKLGWASQKYVELKPGNADAHFALGLHRGHECNWKVAAAEFSRGLELNPAAHEYWCLAAYLYRADDDAKGYARICRELIKRFGDTKDPVIAERTAKACLMLPDALSADDFDRVQKLAELAVTGTERHDLYKWFELAKGLADFRAGRDAEAVKWLERIPANPDGFHFEATVFAILSMAYQRLGRSEEANAALTKAKTIVAKVPSQENGLAWGSWRYGDIGSWLHACILTREAEGLLKMK